MIFQIILEFILLVKKMNWYKRSQQEFSLEYWDKKYPLAGETVNGLTVMNNIYNMSSIQASMNNYFIYRGIREVPISDFTSGKSYSATENRKSEELAKRIQINRRISPLIVAIDEEGPYILEGGHRLYALQLLGVSSFPALVVFDQDREVYELV